MKNNELKWLYNLGFALHWLYPKSKMPIGSNWQQGPRKSWKELTESSTNENNVGVRTGQPSQFADGTFLIILDIDVKSNDPEDAKAAYSAARTFIGKNLDAIPQVASGRGGFSKHLYVRCKTPKTSFNLIRCKKLVKVKMPSIKPGKNDVRDLSEKELKEGWRIRPAFEIDVLGSGKQAAIPPSIHPDSGKPYKWTVPIGTIQDMPLVSEEKFKNLNQNESTKTHVDITFKEVDIYQLGLSEKALNLIESLEGLDAYGGDRSAALFGVMAEMVLKSLDDNTIVNVLSDTMWAISEVVTDRVGTNLDKCAAWILPQIQKMRYQNSTEKQFSDTGLFDDTDWESKVDQSQSGQKVYDEIGGWRLDLDKNQQGGTKMNLKNCSLYLRNICDIDKWLGHNLFTGEVEFLAAPPWAKKNMTDLKMKGQMLSDSDVVETRLFLSRREKFEPTGHLMLESMISCARTNSFHPVRDYLQTLSWDGVGRIDNWLHNYFGAEDTSYTQAVGRKLLIAAITRVMKPGCKFDHVVILEGKQGIGKSTALRVLSEPWFCDSLGDVTNKDVIQQIQGSWIVEIGELASMDRASVNALKDFVSKQEDKARLAYQRLAQKFPRQCILIGTTNDEEYLKDLTGNRRFWPVEVEKTHQIEMEALALDRDMLWAEAFDLYKKNTESLWLDDKKVKLEAEAIQRSKMVSDPWDETIQKWIGQTRPKQCNPSDTYRLEVQHIWRETFGRSEASMTKGDQMRIAGSLKRLGFKHKRTNGRTFWESFI